MSRPGFSVGAELKGGKLTLDNEQKYRGLVQRLRDGRYTVTIEKETHNRSLAQNRYYQGVVVERFAEYTGDRHDDAHEILKLHCNPKILIDFSTKREVVIGGSTAELNVEEFSAYCTRCQQWIAEHCDGLYVPDPNEDGEFGDRKPAKVLQASR